TANNPEHQPQAAPTQTINSSPALSLRAEQAHADVLALGVSDDYRTLYNVEEGLTRGEHTARLNITDQLAREAFERGATINDSILSIPKDPDARPIDASKVTIGTEAHAIDFVRGFIDNAEPAHEEIHQFTLELAEENRAAALREPAPEEQIQVDAGNREQNAHLLYLHELHSNSQGLASIGELTGFSPNDFNSHDQTAVGDENQIYADMFEQGVLEEIEFATPEGDHLGAER